MALEGKEGATSQTSGTASLPDLASVVSQPANQSAAGQKGTPADGSLVQALGLQEAKDDSVANTATGIPTIPPAKQPRLRRFLSGIGVALLVLVAGFLLFRHNGWLAANKGALLGQVYHADSSSLASIAASGIQPASSAGSGSLTVNGQVSLNGRLVLASTGQLSGFSTGQIYFNKQDGKLYFYNGSSSVDLTQQTAAPGVTSLQGLTGSVALTGGTGIVVSGTTISNNGVLSIAAGDPTMAITSDGQGHYTVTNNSAASTVLLQTSSPGTAQTGNVNLTGTIIAGQFSGDGSALSNLNANAVSSGTLSDLRLSSNVTLAGNTFNGPNQLVKLDPSGDLPPLSAINLTNLNVSNATAGILSDLRLSSNVTLAGNTFNGANQLLKLNASGYLPVVNGSNLVSLNAGSIANGTLADGRLSSNVALLNASQTFSGNNTFSAGITTSSINPTGTLTVGSSGQSLVLQGNNATTITATDAGHTTTIGFNGTPVGDLEYNFDTAAGTGVYTICTTIGNCAGSGSGVTTPGGTVNHLARFTGSQAIGDSLISDNGATVTVKNLTDTTNAFQIQNAAGTSNLLVADTTNTRIGIGTNTPGYMLDVNGDINSATGLRVGGNLVCTASGCAAAGSSGFYIQNSTSQQATANFNIQSASSSAVGAVIAGATGQTADLLRLNQGGTTVAKVDPTGNLDITGMYKINGSQIGSNNLADVSNVAKLDRNLQVFTGSNSFQNALDSTTAFQIQNAAGTSNLLVADTSNTRIGIGTNTPGYTLDVNGDINVASGGSFRIGGVAICGVAATCAPSSGSSYYIQNSAAQQTNANFNIQSANATAVGGIIRGATGQTADLLRLQAGDGTNVVTVGASGDLTVQGDSYLANLNVTGNTDVVGLTTTGLASLASLSVAGTSTLNNTLTVNADVIVGANHSLVVTGGISYPASPVAGQVYYRSDTSQLMVYTGSKWQADRSSATEIVAASNTQNKEKADFVGDGTNDQNAINAAIAALPSSGGSVVLLEGTYNIAATINLNKSNVSITGQGNSTILTRMYDGSTNDGIITLLSDSNSIQNLKINGNKSVYSNANNTGVIAGSARNYISILSTTITNNAGYGVYSGWNILGSPNRGQWSMNNNLITSNTKTGVSLTRDTLTANGNTFSSNGGSGLALTSCANDTGGGYRMAYGATIAGNIAQNNTGTGLNIECVYSSITGNTASYNLGGGIYVGAAGSVASGNTASYNTGYGIYSYNASAPGVVISSNTITHNTQSIHIRDRGTVNANYFSSNTSGVQLFGSNIIFENNTMVDSGGVSFTGGVAGGVQVINNSISSSTSISINIPSILTGTYLSGNALGANVSITDSGVNTVYYNQTDSNGNIINSGQAGIGLNTTSPTASLQNAGSFVQGGLGTPTAPSVTVNGTAGSTTWGYKVTATDGVGETLASTETQVTTGNATLSATNYNQVVPNRVSGAVSYKVYRTTAGGSPATTGFIGAIPAGSPNFYLNDTGLAASGSTPTTNTTGNVTISGALMVGSATTPTNKITVNSATTTDSLAQVMVSTGAAGNKGLVVQGVSGQTGNLQQWQSNTGVALAWVNKSGAIRVGQDIGFSNGATPIFSGQGGSGYVGIALRGFNSGKNDLLFETQGNPGNQVFAIYGGGNTVIRLQDSTAVGLTLVSHSSQSGDLQQWQSSTGTVLAKVDATGSLTVVNATVTGTLTVTSAATFNSTLTVNGHIITGNTSGTTTVTAGPAATCSGGSPSVSVSGNDTSGTVTITTGTGCVSGTLATVSFAGAYGAAPRVSLTPASGGAAGLQYYNGTTGTGSFTIDAGLAPADSTTYTYNYFVAQ